MKYSYLFLGLFCVLSSSAMAAPGTLDTTLAGTGKLRVGLGYGLDDARAMVRQSDGKLIVVGSSANPSGSDFSLVRYTTAGALDTTFGSGGKVLTSIDPGDESATSVAVLSDGKILVAGRYSVNLALVKYNANGTIDTTFGGGDGIATPGVNTGGSDPAMAVQSDGKIVIVVDHTVARLLTDGTLDPSFSGDGITFRPGKGQPNLGGCDGLPHFRSVGIQSDGKIVIAGEVVQAGVDCYFYDVALIRYLSNGTRDSSFGTNGVATRPHTTDKREAAYSFAFIATTTDSDHIVVAGESDSRFTLWSFNREDGSVDTTFGVGGARITTFPGSSSARARSVKFQTSFSLATKIIAAGDTGTAFVVVRYTLDGAVDTTFNGGAGYVLTPLTDLTTDTLRSMVIQPSDNKIVVAGTDASDFAVVRYTASGSLDTTFDGDGIRLEDIGNATVAGQCVAIQPDGKTVVGAGNFVSRLNADGTFDSSFASGGKVRLGFAINALVLQPDGRILVTGGGFGYARLNPDGTPDTGFGTGGVIDSSTSANLVSNSLALQEDGKILAAGYNLVNGHYAFVVNRRMPNGASDPTFTNTTTAVDSGDDRATALALQSDGRILVAGSASGSLAVIRCNPDGSLDPSFSFDGKQFVFAVPNGATGLRILGDKIYLSGSVAGFALCRLNLSDGAIDMTFSGDGVASAPAGSFQNISCGLVAQADGKLVVGGSATTTNSSTPNDFALVRFNPDGTPDGTYGTGGKVLIDFNAGANDVAYGLALDPLGRAVIVGQADRLLGIARLTSEPFARITSIVRNVSDSHIVLAGLVSPGVGSSLQQAVTPTSTAFAPLATLVPDAAGHWTNDTGTPASPHFFRVIVP